MAKKRRGNFMQTWSGKRFWPLDPRPGDICIRDIAWHLSNTCRYRGAVSRYYSVAEHSVLVSRNVPAKYAREALMHDAAEAYIGDMVRPLKYQPEMLPFREAEAKLEQVIFERFNIVPTPKSREYVKEADNRILYDETAAFLKYPSWSNLGGYEPLGCEPTGYLPYTAYCIFMTEFERLFPEEVQVDPRRISKAGAKNLGKATRRRRTSVSSPRTIRRGRRIR